MMSARFDNLTPRGIRLLLGTCILAAVGGCAGLSHQNLSAVNGCACGLPAGDGAAGCHLGHHGGHDCLSGEGPCGPGRPCPGQRILHALAGPFTPQGIVDPYQANGHPPHSKFHPVPTRPVFAPQPVFQASPAAEMTLPTGAATGANRADPPTPPPLMLPEA